MIDHIVDILPRINLEYPGTQRQVMHHPREGR